MRASDLARLKEPYPEDEDLTGERPMLALGLPLRRWRKLKATIFDDFVQHQPYGIGWWAPEPGKSRRILISDQLYACLDSVSTNMIEAVLDWLEYQDCAERDSERYVDIVHFQGTEPVISLPRARNALEEISDNIAVMHIVGMARGLSAALDCVAGAIIGVVAVPVSILKADWGSMGKAFAKISKGTTPGELAQAGFYAKFNEVVASAGPEGWLDWALDFRNMLVHRGRRIQNGEFIPKTPALLDSQGNEVPRVRRLTFLPRDPGKSDVEVWRHAPKTNAPLDALMLAENATQTLNGLLESTKMMISETAKLLIDVWQWRRDNPTILPQPASQWKDGVSMKRSVFQGYAPRPRPTSSSSAASIHAVEMRRFLAASLDDAHRQQWDTFD